MTESTPYARLPRDVVEQARFIADDRDHGTTVDFWDHVDTPERWAPRPWDESYPEQRAESCLAAAGDRSRCSKRPAQGAPFCGKHMRRAMAYFYAALLPTELAEREADMTSHMLAHAAFAQADHDRSLTRVYFYELGGYVKIGVSRRLAERIATFQRGQGCTFPADVTRRDGRLVGHLPGDEPLERAIHYQLREHWVSGEWFRLTEPVVGAMDALLSSRGAVRCPNEAVENVA